MKAYWYDVIREIRQSASRFLSLIIITALGALSIVGIYATAIDMRTMADKTYKAQVLFDLQFKSTTGFNDEDILAIAQQAEVETAEAAFSFDAYLALAGKSLTVRTHSLPTEINKIDLLQGRLPQKANECLLEEALYNFGAFQLGQTITLGLDDKENYDKFLVTDIFMIVGVVKSPLYINDHDRGNSQLGDGRINYYLYLPETSYNLEVFTDLYIKLTGTSDVDNLSASYNSLVEQSSTKLRLIADRQVAAKKSEYAELRSEIDEARLDYNQAESKLKTNLAKAKNKLTKVNRRLKKMKTLINKAQFKLSSLAALSQVELRKKENQLTAAQKELTAYLTTLNAYQTEINHTRQQLNAALVQLQQQGPYGSDSQLDSKYDEVYDSLALLAIKQAEIDQAFLYVADQQAIIDYSRQQLKLAQAQLATEIKKAQKTINKKLALYHQGLQKYKIALATLKSREITNFAELEEARVLIEEAQDELDQAPEPEWFYLSRQDTGAFESYYQDTLRLQKIGYVLPLMFLTVAVLMTMTSMTRMVDEQRNQIGLYKALGYSAFTILSKYLIYAGSVSLIGGLLGVVLGSNIIPRVIFSAYAHLYQLPNIETPIPFTISLFAIVLVTSLVVAVTLFSFLSTVKETAAELMRPKAPSYGHSIFLERVNFLWRKFGFLTKVTVRNIFRYKKRVLMTLFGIAGSTALILTAFGLNDSISNIGPQQYNRIINYDSVVYLKDQTTEQQKQELNRLLPDKYLYLATKVIKIPTPNSNFSAYLYVPENEAALNDFINLYDIKNHQPVYLPVNGAIITEKIARTTGCKVGDTLSFSWQDGPTYSVTISAVVENYIFNYLYLSPATYKSLFAEQPLFNRVLVGKSDDSQLANSLLTSEVVRAVVNTADVKNNIINSTDVLQTVALVLVIIACSLALVVLFNLTNLNITERLRELATIKVLGFFDSEVALYIYRETILITVIGILFGLVGGYYLNSYILTSLEIDLLVFPQIIKLSSYLLAAGLSASFGVFVNFIMRFKIKRIRMVESLKSVE